MTRGGDTCGHPAAHTDRISLQITGTQTQACVSVLDDGCNENPDSVRETNIKRRLPWLRQQGGCSEESCCVVKVTDNICVRMYRLYSLGNPHGFTKTNTPAVWSLTDRINREYSGVVFSCFFSFLTRGRSDCLAVHTHCYSRFGFHRNTDFGAGINSTVT